MRDSLVLGVLLVFSVVGGLVGTGVVTAMWLRARREAGALETRFRGVADAEVERQRVQAEVEQLKADLAGIQRTASDQRTTLASELAASRATVGAELAAQRATQRSEAERERAELGRELHERRARFDERFATALADLERLTREVGALDEKATLQSFGLYRPFYDFGTSDEYRARLEQVRAEQARALKESRAAVCPVEWTVDGDKRKGKQMTERSLKLMLRAFNGECDAAIARVRFNNVVAIEERIKGAYEAINKLGEPNRCSLEPAYLDLKLAELRLTHEHAEKIQAEKEEQREIRERLRDEEAAQKEFERAKREAEKEEQRYELAVERARAQLEAAEGARRQEMATKLAELEQRLQEADAAKARAVSQAQLTKAGHVYVISNIGAFGEAMFKVGMTRRLEPEERVRELSDASVPFSFDIHAIIYSDNAPALENALHRALAASRVNLVNLRKEFFATTLDEIEVLARQHATGEFSFVRIPVAEEYRKTLLLRAQALGPESPADPAADARSRMAEAHALLDDA